MEREAGAQRDIDANNGYKDHREHLWRDILETAGAHVGWFEELVPENVAHYTRLRERMEKAGIRGEIAAFLPYLEPKRLYDVVRMDIRRGGFLDNAELARVAARAGAQCVPHNWGSQIGGFMGLHLSRAIASAPAAEDDRSTCGVVIAEGYRFKDGYYTVPDTPGLSLSIDKPLYQRKCAKAEIRLS